MNYRRDIDGLRALAVLPVVFYHVGTPAFSGGFCGVDIFFVISGFLITSLIAEEVRRGEFSIVRFYERRIRRIFPALIAVLVFSSVVAWQLLLPDTFRQFGSSVVSTVFFASNVLFWRQSGYFEAPASEKPLLHTWSLAVEEQFYILFPILLYVIHRWLKEKWAPWLGSIAAVSFGLSVVGVHMWPSATFYLAPTRAWELMFGALLALDVMPAVRPRMLREMLSLAGLALIAWSIFGLSASSRFPGPNALYPCIGAALLIHTGRTGDTCIKWLLGTRPMVFVGLISYSLYLWHWPITVFAKSNHDFTNLDRFLIIAASFLAAVLSWAYIEMPFRRPRGVLDRKLLFAAASLAMALIAGFGTFVYALEGRPSRFDPRVLEIASYSNSKDPRESACLGGDRHPVPIDRACTYGADVPATIALWGDSHAGALASSIGEAAKREGKAFKFIGRNACPPVVGVGRIDNRNCLSHNAEAMRFLTSTPTIRVAIIFGRYSVNLYGGTADFGPAEKMRSREPLITDSSGAQLDVPDAEALFARGMFDTVDRLEAAGKTVVLVYPVPETGYDIPNTLARMALYGKDPGKFDRPAAYFLQRQKFIFRVLDSVGTPGRTVRIYPHQFLCKAGRCSVSIGGKPLYRDDDHLSLAGGRLLEPLFDSVFRGESSPPAPEEASQSTKAR